MPYWSTSNVVDFPPLHQYAGAAHIVPEHQETVWAVV